MASLVSRLRGWARGLKQELLALSLAARHPQTPWTARVLAALVLAYALSPVDLIPDFIPVLGQLDDLLLVPAGLWLALRLIPAPILQEARQRAAEQGGRPPRSRAGTLLTLLVYALLYAAALWLAWRWWAG